MLKYMLDTNLCIRVLRDRPQSLRERFNAEASSLCISSIVLYELLYGAAKSQRPDHHRHEVEKFPSEFRSSTSTPRQPLMQETFAPRSSATAR
jgi:tRNA(fMet)-specific endonuclease VapC